MYPVSVPVPAGTVHVVVIIAELPFAEHVLCEQVPPLDDGLNPTMYRLVAGPVHTVAPS